MSTVLEQHIETRTAVDERPARRALRAQLARLEEERAGLLTSAWPRTDVLPSSAAGVAGGARVLTIGELEARRDRLAQEIDQARNELARRTALEEESRRRREEMLLHPERHRGMTISNEEMGEPGCTRFQVRPRLGLLGMLMNWWRVVVSSGCP